MPALEQVQQLLTRDGRHRGMAWALLNGKDSIQQFDSSSSSSKAGGDGDDDPDANEPAGTEREGPGDRQAFRDYARRIRIRWTIAFEDENEARRFVRRWHLRPFPEADRDRIWRGAHAPAVHAEFLW